MVYTSLWLKCWTFLRACSYSRIHKQFNIPQKGAVSQVKKWFWAKSSPRRVGWGQDGKVMLFRLKIIPSIPSFCLILYLLPLVKQVSIGNRLLLQNVKKMSFTFFSCPLLFWCPRLASHYAQAIHFIYPPPPNITSNQTCLFNTYSISSFCINSVDNYSVIHSDLKLAPPW